MASVQLIVDPSHGSQLVGSRGCVISEMERDSRAKIAVERGNGGEKTVSVAGDERSKRDAFEIIFQKLESLGANMQNVQILIPPQSVTAIVGKGGSVVKGLQDDSGAHIDLPRRGSSEPGRVHITGSPNSVLKALIGIDGVVQNDRVYNRGPERLDSGRQDFGRHDRFDRRDDGRRGDFRMDHRDRFQDRSDFGQRRVGNNVPIDFLLGGSLARSLVGKGGSVVQGIERRSGSKVNVSKSQGNEEENRLVSISGGDKSEALKLTLERLEDTINEPIASVHFQVPRGSARLIIGSGGTTINGIQRESNARVDVGKDESDSGTVTISGTIRQIVRAAEMVYDIVGSDKKMMGGGAPINGKRDMDRFDDAPQPQRRRKEGPTFELLVPGRVAPKLVGPSGSVVNQISDESGAHVDVEKGNTQQKSVIVTGSADSRRRAVEMILTRMDEADPPLRDATMRIPLTLITAVVGPKGARVKQLEEDTQARIHIARRDGNEIPGSIQVVGSLNHIIDAFMQIDNIITSTRDEREREKESGMVREHRDRQD